MFDRLNERIKNTFIRQKKATDRKYRLYTADNTVNRPSRPRY